MIDFQRAKIMASFFSHLQNLIEQDPLFWFCALSGSLLFVIQFLLSFLGVGDDMEDSAGDSVKLQWLSKQAVTGFLMLFGWVGLTCKKEFHLLMWSSLAIASLAGLFAILVTALLFRAVKKLRTPGTVFRIEDAIGKEALIYQRIPKGGVGKISLTLNDLLYEIDALSHQDEELSSFTKVQVLNISDEKTVIVIPIK